MYTKAAYRSMFCSLHFSCICLSMKITSTVPVGPEPILVSGVFFCALVWDERIQQDMGQDFACNGEQSDASKV